MDLHGWPSPGRNIDSSLHHQLREIISRLRDKNFSDEMTWGNDIQDKLAAAFDVKSGQVRTIKSMCSSFGLLDAESFDGKNVLSDSPLLTERGETIYSLITLEDEINDSDSDDKDAVLDAVKNLYEDVYCDAMGEYLIEDASKNLSLHPAKIALWALEKYGSLDKWEWYLLNTCIQHDNSPGEEKIFHEAITKYREKIVSYGMNDVKSQQKGHQYIPQYLDYAGLVLLDNGSKWRMSKSKKHPSKREKILGSDTQGGSLDE